MPGGRVGMDRRRSCGNVSGVAGFGYSGKPPRLYISQGVVISIDAVTHGITTGAKTVIIIEMRTRNSSMMDQ